MQPYDLNIPASGSQMVAAVGEYIRCAASLVGVTETAIEITPLGGTTFKLLPGQAVNLKKQYSRWLIRNTSGAGSLVGEVMIGDGEFTGERVTGSVTVANAQSRNGAYSQSVATVTTAASQLLAANSSRLFLMIQNTGAGNIYVNFSGTATVANGFKIPPGGAWEAGAYCPTGAVSVIGDIASNPNVIVVQG